MAAENTAVVISTSTLVKSYKGATNTRVEVLRGVSISIPRNKISVIAGASGAGKSTLLHLLGALDRPDSGSILLEGTDLSKINGSALDTLRNREFGFVFQFHHLLPEFTALENVAIPGMIAGHGMKKSAERGMELLELVGMAHRAAHKPAELSGGEQQRAAVARALANNPGIIFADEPTGNLDSANSEQIHQLFVRLRDEFAKTLVIVTHNRELMALADHSILLQDGRVTDEQ